MNVLGSGMTMSIGMGMLVVDSLTAKISVANSTGSGST